jgi:CxxC-x17-CxxC domain-containing protein
MYPATCGECGKSCQVPFRPSGDKPVLCSDCFGNSRGESRGGDRNDRPMRDFAKPSYAPKNTFHTGNENRGNDDMKKQFDTLSNKLDTIITLLSKTTEAPKKADKDLGEIIKQVTAPEKTPAKKEVKTTAKKVTKVATKKVVAKKTAKKK